MTDFSELDNLLNRLIIAAEESIPIAAEVVKDNILERTAAGRNANNREFPKWRNYNNKPSKVQPFTYSPAQSKKRALAGLVTDIKTISFRGNTMLSLALRNPSGSLAPKTGTQLTVSNANMQIMVGQMQHPKWSFHHNVLGVNDKDLKEINVAIHSYLQRAI